MAIEDTGAVRLPILCRTPMKDVPPAFWQLYLKSLGELKGNQPQYWTRPIAAVRLTTSSVFTLSWYDSKRLLTNPRTNAPLAPGATVTLSGVKFLHTLTKSSEGIIFGSMSQASFDRQQVDFTEVLQRLRMSPNMPWLDLSKAAHRLDQFITHPWEYGADGRPIESATAKPEDPQYSRSLFAHQVVELSPMMFVVPLGHSQAVMMDMIQVPHISKVGAPAVMTENDQHFVRSFKEGNNTVLKPTGVIAVPVVQRSLLERDAPVNKWDIVIDLNATHVMQYGTIPPYTRLVSTLLAHTTGLAVINVAENSNRQWSDAQPSTHAYCEALFIEPYLAYTITRAAWEVPSVVATQLCKPPNAGAAAQIVPNPINEQYAATGVLCITDTVYDSADELKKLNATAPHRYFLLTREVPTLDILAEREQIVEDGLLVARLNAHVLFNAKWVNKSGEPLHVPQAHRAVKSLSGSSAMRIMFAVRVDAIERATALALCKSDPNAKRIMTPLDVPRIAAPSATDPTTTVPAPAAAGSKRTAGVADIDQSDDQQTGATSVHANAAVGGGGAGGVLAEDSDSNNNSGDDSAEEVNGAPRIKRRGVAE
jgi:hypothetical protein